MAHAKAKGTSKLGRDSAAQRLGVKLFGGQKVKSGEIIVRQRGTKWHPGENVAKGGDDTLYAKIAGVVEFEKRKLLGFQGTPRWVSQVKVVGEKLTGKAS